MTLAQIRKEVSSNRLCSDSEGTSNFERVCGHIKRMIDGALSDPGPDWIHRTQVIAHVKRMSRDDK